MSLIPESFCFKITERENKGIDGTAVMILTNLFLCILE